MNKKTDIPSLSSNDKDRIIALIKDNSENYNLESNTNRGKGIANRRFVIKYQDVIKRCYEEGITIRNIYKGLMDIEKHDLSERTFYRLCNLYVFTDPKLTTESNTQNHCDITPSSQQVSEAKRPINQKDNDNNFNLSIHEDSGIGKKFEHNSVPDINKILLG